MGSAANPPYEPPGKVPAAGTIGVSLLGAVWEPTCSPSPRDTTQALGTPTLLTRQNGELASE